MDETSNRVNDDDDDLVEVVVIRSGGIAGMRREWAARPAAAEYRAWEDLVEHCPWDAESELSEPGAAAPTAARAAAPAGATHHRADGFVWRIEVRRTHSRSDVVLADSTLVGPWRRLVDAVRRHARESGGAEPPAPGASHDSGAAR